MKYLPNFIFYTLLTLANSVYGQEATNCDDKIFEDPLLEKITGTWSATGNIGGDNIAYHLEAHWVLNHQFIELSMVDTAATPQYAANVFIGYDCVSERYVAHWIDNFGARFSETLGYGTRTGQSLAFRFEYPEGPFINQFIYNIETDTWQFHTTTKNSKGVWVTFGDIFLKRKSAK